jgi:sigma-B regulation protein RsbU (phosphoserine phosphatase)
MDNPKILIVDDEPFNIDYLEQELEESGYTTISAINGQEALDLIQSEAPDLVLLDIMMPIMDGYQVLSKMKDDPNTRDIPVIVISATNNIKNVVKGIELGAEDFLPKPFEPILLHARISASLDKKRLRDLQKLYIKSLEREFEIASEIQQGFLPSELPSVAGWEIAACFKAAREVAGDFYDAFVLPDGNLVCLVGDVCDKGVGSALFMTLFRSLIRATATTDYFLDQKHQQTLTPEERLVHITSFVNNYVSTTHGDTNMFATVFIGIFSKQDGELTYINCGNEPALITRKESILASLPPTSPVIGIIPDAKFSAKKYQMQKDDLLLAFTDGIIDAMNKDDDAFGNERLHEVITEGGATPSIMINHINETVCQFVGPAAQFDDITLLAVKRVD